MCRWNQSWNFLCGVPRTWHSAGRERGRSPSKGGWIWKGRTCFTRWWGQGHLSQSRTNTNCCSWFEPVPRSWAKLRCYWTSNDLDCFAALVNRLLHFSFHFVQKLSCEKSSVLHIRFKVSRDERKEQLWYRNDCTDLFFGIYCRTKRSILANNVISNEARVFETMLNRGEIAWDVSKFAYA